MLKTTIILKGQLVPLKSFFRHICYPLNFNHYLQNIPSTRYTKLVNGLTIATEERDSCSACIGLFVDAGSRYESKAENGIAHFFEHLAFKETVARNKKELEKQMGHTGATFKCCTTREMIVYYVQCLPQSAALATELLIDCVYKNKLCPEDIDHEKTVVCSEMLQHDDNPSQVVIDYLHATAFQGTPLGQSVMGTSSNLCNFDKAMITEYLARCFIPSRTVLAAAGGVKHELLVTLAKAHLSAMVPLKCLDEDVYRYTGSEVRYRDDSMPTANIMVAVEGPSFSDNNRMVMEVAKYILGGWDRSQPGGMAHATRIAREASCSDFCDSYQAFNITYKDVGLFGVHFVSNVMRQDDMMMSIQEQFMHLSVCVTEPEVERAKAFLKVKILSEMESNLGTCMDVGRWTLYCGSRPSLLAQVRSLELITVEHVRAACYKYLYNQCPVVAAVGPVEGLLEYPRTRASMWWLRY